MKKIVFVIVLLLAISAYADEPPSWSEFEVLSANGNYVATIRAKGETQDATPHGRSYVLEVFAAGGGGRALWSSEYRYDGYSWGVLSDDGTTFAYVNFWYYDSDPVVTIYRVGNIKEIQGREFGLKPSILLNTVSHRVWLRDEAPAYRFVDAEGTLALEINTRDGGRHLIEARSGRFLR